MSTTVHLTQNKGIDTVISVDGDPTLITIGQLGPRGEKGEKGEKGDKGDKGDRGEPAEYPIFQTRAEADDWSAQNPGRVAFSRAL